ncbi:uncharacterized protein LOC62_02G003394 [Vanrija pseudolonga]|uniref:Uncharacterized protein n=1 Tax=Vanrija pseudolonga TaxID=143232 RepID=A0AAF0Y4I2_9TREE|nr:hypothetical protein LOC62_02G003394 [Vanrija pseudolonga]
MCAAGAVVAAAGSCVGVLPDGFAFGVLDDVWAEDALTPDKTLEAGVVGPGVEDPETMDGERTFVGPVVVGAGDAAPLPVAAALCDSRLERPEAEDSDDDAAVGRPGVVRTCEAGTCAFATRGFAPPAAAAPLAAVPAPPSTDRGVPAPTGDLARDEGVDSVRSPIEDEEAVVDGARAGLRPGVDAPLPTGEEAMDAGLTRALSRGCVEAVEVDADTEARELVDGVGVDDKLIWPVT